MCEKPLLYRALIVSGIILMLALQIVSNTVTGYGMIQAVRAGGVEASKTMSDYPVVAAYSPDGWYLAVAVVDTLDPTSTHYTTIYIMGRDGLVKLETLGPYNGDPVGIVWTLNNTILLLQNQAHPILYVINRDTGETLLAYTLDKLSQATSLTWNPLTGTIIVTGSTSGGGSLVEYEVYGRSLYKVHEYSFPKTVYYAEISPDGRYIVVGWGEWISIIDRMKDEVIVNKSYDTVFSQVSWLGIYPENNTYTLVAAGYSGSQAGGILILLFNPSSRDTRIVFTSPQKGTHSYGVVGYSNYIIWTTETGAYQYRIDPWNPLPTNKTPSRIGSNPSYEASPTHNKKGDILLLSPQSKVIEEYRVDVEEPTTNYWPLERPPLRWETGDLYAQVRGVSWSPDGKQVAVGVSQYDYVIVSYVMVFDDKGELVWKSNALNGTIYGVAWSPDGERIASSVAWFDESAHSHILVFDHNGSLLWESDDLGVLVYDLAWDGSGDRLAVGVGWWDDDGYHGRVLVLGSDGKLLWKSGDLGGEVRTVSWGSNGSGLAAGVVDRVIVFDSNGSVLWQSRSMNGLVWSVAWSPEGEELAVGGDFGLTVLDGNGDILWTDDSLSGSVLDVAWSPSGDRLVVGGTFNGAIIFDCYGHNLGVLEYFSEWVYAVSWSPDGEKIVVGTIKGYDEYHGRLVLYDLYSVYGWLRVAGEYMGSLVFGFPGGFDYYRFLGNRLEIYLMVNNKYVVTYRLGVGLHEYIGPRSKLYSSMMLDVPQEYCLKYFYNNTPRIIEFPVSSDRLGILYITYQGEGYDMVNVTVSSENEVLSFSLSLGEVKRLYVAVPSNISVVWSVIANGSVIGNGSRFLTIDRLGSYNLTLYQAQPPAQGGGQGGGGNTTTTTTTTPPLTTTTTSQTTTTKTTTTSQETTITTTTITLPAIPQAPITQSESGSEQEGTAEGPSPTGGGTGYGLDNSVFWMVIAGVGLILGLFILRGVSKRKATIPATTEETRRGIVERRLEGFPPALVKLFTPLEKLGEGGMGIVWKVRDKRDNKVYALKTPNYTMLERFGLPREEVDRLFLREAVHWEDLGEHPNIVRLYEYSYEPAVYMKLEYIDGIAIDGTKIRSVRDLIRYYKGRNSLIPPSLVARIILEAGRGLAYAHSKGLAHLDIKPENLMIAGGSLQELNVKLTDWGIAKLAGSLGISSIAGLTLSYAAPELRAPEAYKAVGIKPGLWSDIYSLGKVLEELLTLNQSSPLDSVPVTIPQPELWEKLYELAREMTDPDPTKRPTAEEVVEALKRLLKELDSGKEA